MAKPPDGASSWRKHADVWVLRDGDGVFARLTVAVDGGGASITMPFADSPEDGFYVARFAAGAAGPTVQIGDRDTAMPWAIAGVLASPWQILPRKRMSGESVDAAPRATLTQHPDGALALVDAAGRQRVVARRMPAPDALHGVARLPACAGALCFDVASFPGTSVEHQQSSLP